MSGNPDPNALLQEIESLKDELNLLGNEFASARRNAAAMEQEYEKEVAKIYITLLSPKGREEFGLDKLPAEDMRKAIAHSKMDENTWSAYLMSRADMEAADKMIKVKTAILTGIQTQLAHLRTEMSHA